MHRSADQGLTAGSGNTSRAIGVLVGDANLSSLTPGDEVWLRIGRPGSGAGDFIVDNVAVAVVPFP